MFNGQVLFLAAVVVAMLSLPMALAWVVFDAWLDEWSSARRATIVCLTFDAVTARLY